MSFTLKAVEELGSLHGDPEWARARRRSAFEVFERLEMPAKHEEEWRRTDLKGLDLEVFAPFEDPNGAQPRAPVEGAAGVLRQRGSEAGSTELAESARRQGVLFMPLSQAVREHRELVERHLFSLVSPERDKFTALQASFYSGGTFLYVPDGVVVEEPFVSQIWSGGGGAAILPHTVIVAGQGSIFNHIDEFSSPDLEQPAIASGSAEIFAGHGSNVGYVAIQRWGRHTWQFADQRARLEQEATLRLINVGLGGRLAKVRMEADLVAPGASAELKGLYFGSGEQFFDYHTLQRHEAGNTTSDLLYKGALRDRAHSLYAGLIRIEKFARGSDAYQANRNLLLSEGAGAHPIPMLEILNNDVRCTHGATVSPIDTEHLFYLRSRGIPAPVAERMIVQGFFGEVLARIPAEQTRLLVEQELEARIG
jgi:Fe-S cluster assembly protein SufD